MDDQGVIARLGRESACVEVFIGEGVEFYFPRARKQVTAIISKSIRNLFAKEDVSIQS